MNDNQSVVSECRSSCEGQGDRAARGSIRLCCLHKRPVTEGKADVIDGDRMTTWLNYFPVNSSPRSSKIRRQSLCLVCALSIRSRVPDEGLTVCCYEFSWPLASSALLEASLVRELSPLSTCLAVN